MSAKLHVSLNVQDVEKSIRFYEKVFGVKPMKVREGYAKFDVMNPAVNFVLNQIPQEQLQQRKGSEETHLSHLGIQVDTTKDVLQWKERLEAEGILTQDEMQVTCCYALQDKIWLHDPDGHAFEVFTVLEDQVDLHGKAEGVCCAPVPSA